MCDRAAGYEVTMSEPEFEQEVRLPKTGAEALVDLAYQDKRDRKALSRLTMLLDDSDERGVKVISVRLTDAQVLAVREAAKGYRAAGIATTARKVHEALKSFDNYRPGATPRATRGAGQSTGGPQLERGTSGRAAWNGKSTPTRVHKVQAQSESGTSASWFAVCDRCGWLSRSETKAAVVSASDTHRCPRKRQ